MEIHSGISNLVPPVERMARHSGAILESVVMSYTVAPRSTDIYHTWKYATPSTTSRVML